MQERSKGHLSIAELENYSLGRLDALRVAMLEEHLLVCSQCTEKLTEIEPCNFVHYTREGPFYSRVTRVPTGSFFARHWNRNLEGGRPFRTIAAAKAYLTRSFSQMFPEHVCSRNCGSTNPRPEPRKQRSGRQ